MIGYRQVDPRFPFLWETPSQPPGRWHADGEGPVHYFADSADGAWAEFLRLEEITDPDDVTTSRRALWSVEIGRKPTIVPRLHKSTMIGGEATYPACRAEARRLRKNRVRRIIAPSAAMLPRGVYTWKVDGGLKRATSTDGQVIVIFGRAPHLKGAEIAREARPNTDLVSRVRTL